MYSEKAYCFIIFTVKDRLFEENKFFPAAFKGTQLLIVAQTNRNKPFFALA
jgi:hypothetical protein